MPLPNELTPRERRKIIAIVEANDSALAEKLTERLEGREEQLMGMFRQVLKENSDSMQALAANVTTELRSFRNAAVVLLVLMIVGMVALTGKVISVEGAGFKADTKGAHTPTAIFAPVPEI